MSVSKLAVVVTRLKTNTVVLTKTHFALHNRASRFSTPTALCPPAQGCEARATLGVWVVDVSQPQRGCGMVPRRADGRNPVGVDCVWRALPKVAYVHTVGVAYAPRALCSVPSRRLGAVADVRLNDGGARIPKSRQGRPKVAHGFNRGLRVENGQSPGGAKEKMGLDRCVLSSLTGLVSYSHHNPAMNRPPVRRRTGWAIFERPCGTWNHDTLNGYKVAPRTAQPWAGGRNPVGILRGGRARNGDAK